MQAMLPLVAGWSYSGFSGPVLVRDVGKGTRSWVLLLCLSFLS